MPNKRRWTIRGIRSCNSIDFLIVLWYNRVGGNYIYMSPLSRRLDLVAKREARRKEIKNKKGGVPKKKSELKGVLVKERPDLLNQWSPNNTEDPSKLTLGSHKRVLWLCLDCGVEFSMDVSNMARKKTIRCSKCRDREPTDKNRLSILYPELSLEWHSTKNGDLTPYDISYGKDIHIWWQCSECEYEWSARLNDRTLQGKGCPNCNKYKSKGVRKIIKYFEENNIKYSQEKYFLELKNKGLLKFDFYLEEINMLIEFNGKQHYESVEFFGGEESFKNQKIRDNLKREYCNRNNILLLEIPYWEEKNINIILEKTLTR